MTRRPGSRAPVLNSEIGLSSLLEKRGYADFGPEAWAAQLLFRMDLLVRIVQLLLCRSGLSGFGSHQARPHLFKHGYIMVHEQILIQSAFEYDSVCGEEVMILYRSARRNVWVSLRRGPVPGCTGSPRCPAGTRLRQRTKKLQPGARCGSVKF